MKSTHAARARYVPFIFSVARSALLAVLAFALAAASAPAAITTIALDHILNSSGNAINVLNADTLSLVRAGAGTLTNNGSLNLNSTGGVTDLVISGGDITFDGTGSINLSNFGNNRIYSSASTDRL